MTEAWDLLSIFDQDWHLFPGADQALCKEIGGDLWFPEKGGTPNPAKRICTMCPVREACAEYALHHRVMGVWGGLTGGERRVIARKRGLAAYEEGDETIEECA